MKKKILFAFLIVILLMTMITPATALAAKPEEFSSSGEILGILPSTEFPAGNSGRWVVQERHLIGYLYDGDIANYYFDMNYHANVELYSQEGTFQGTLVVVDSPYTLRVNGQTSSDEPVPIIDGWDPELNLPVYHLEMTLYIDGNYTFADGAKGQGNISGSIVTLLTPEGHVYGFGPGSVSLTGKWQP